MKYENKRVLRRDTKKALKYIEDMRPNSVHLFSKAFAEQPNLYLSYVTHFIESEKKGKKHDKKDVEIIFDDLEISIKQMSIEFVKYPHPTKITVAALVTKINNFLIYINSEEPELTIEESYQIETGVSTYNQDIDPHFDEANALKYLTSLHGYIFNTLLEKHQRKLKFQEQTTQAFTESLSNDYEN